MLKEFSGKIEALIDDDEGMTSLCIRWSDMGGYLCVARDPDEARLYCEYCDQSNGFYSETLSSKWFGNCLEFELQEPESFLRSEKIQKVRVRIPDGEEKAMVCVNRLFE